MLGSLLVVLTLVVRAFTDLIWQWAHQKETEQEPFFAYVWYCRKSPEKFDPGYAANLIWDMKCKRCRYRYMPLAKMLNVERHEQKGFEAFREQAIRLGFKL